VRQRCAGAEQVEVEGVRGDEGRRRRRHLGLPPPLGRERRAVVHGCPRPRAVPSRSKLACFFFFFF
jgi:hypothetical protein